MPVDPTVIHLQVACNGRNMQWFLAIHEHEENAKPNNVT